jgi:hypothetical protein
VESKRRLSCPSDGIYVNVAGLHPAHSRYFRWNVWVCVVSASWDLVSYLLLSGWSTRRIVSCNIIIGSTNISYSLQIHFLGLTSAGGAQTKVFWKKSTSLVYTSSNLAATGEINSMVDNKIGTYSFLFSGSLRSPRAAAHPWNLAISYHRVVTLFEQ